MQESSMEILCDANVYVESFEKCKKGSIWKESVQRYRMNMLRNINRQTKAVKAKNYQQKDFNEFTLNERGKTREIKAIHIDDRVMLRSLCDKIMTPKLSKYLIYDNGASVKGKGIHFTRKRLETHLHKYYRQHGSNDGYILLIDFTKFFDNVQHEKLLEEFSKRLHDDELIVFLREVISKFKIDVSYMDDEEYAYCLSSIFNALEYVTINKELLTGEKFMGKSIGIGSQLSQISGLLYPTRIDNYCKIVKGCKYYGRYMDDTYIIHEDKAYLQQLLTEINAICEEYGIHINHKKTQITKISKTFNFLKVRYSLTETGKVIKRMNKKSITRERRKLKSFKRQYDEGKMTYAEIEEAYGSWRGNLRYYAAWNTIRDMDRLYKELFIEDFLNDREPTYNKKPKWESYDEYLYDTYIRKVKPAA